MDDIAAWLEGIGLGQYAGPFRDHDITTAVLPELTDEDLKELGVSLGHRRLLLRAIKQVGEGGIASAPDSGAPAAARSPPSPTAERRQPTVLFCDLVGSTEQAARLDPEDMREVIAAYQSACSAVVRRFDGHVAKYMATAC